LISVQAPAIDENEAHLDTNTPSSPLFQLTGIEAKTADPRCSESCRSVHCCPSACKVDEPNSNLLFRPTQTHRRLCSNSQELKRRQLAHGARNRAGQLIAGQVPKSTKHQTTHTPSFLTKQSRCSQNTSEHCQSTVQSPRSAGTNHQNNLKSKKFFFLSNTRRLSCSYQEHCRDP
jgi:hypothetical protein